ncbi:MAG TPA: metalloregulator ArsR/SmtB family transcription factor [Trebonia sp.]|nr:metalloregulator ArsR/SmtB family transcription factor [Trebonia sp.]
MLADADLAAVGQALGDAHRARFVLALLGGQELPAGDLAARAGISSSLTSAHLARLLQSGLVSARKLGRQRYYRLARPEIAHAVEALLAIAPQQNATGLTAVTRGKALQRARTCYDHLAGRLGVALADAFEQDRIIVAADSGWDLTGRGQRRLEDLGLDVEALHRHRRSFLRPCLDWTERRPHMAGALGQALASRLIALDWVRRSPGTRAVLVTPRGEQRLLEEFAVKI